MASGMNFNQPNINIPAEQPRVAIDGTAVGRTLKKLAAPVFDFFTKEDVQEENPFLNYEEEIQKVEMRTAITQNILNDSDPKARKKINIVI